MRIQLLLFSFLTFCFANAQNEVRVTHGSVKMVNEFHPDSLYRFQSSIYTLTPKFPSPAGVDPAVKAASNIMREKLLGNKYPAMRTSAKRAAITPIVKAGFSGATIAGTPNDNNVAVNSDSLVISVMNTYIRVYNTSGVLKKNWGLEFFPKDPKATKPGTGVGDLNRSYDPKVVYDPASDRFIIVFLEGDGSADTRIIVSFSKTNNPLDGWNVYQLPGNPFGGAFWTDYPMIAINGEDLFITVNILKDNTDWKVGFTQSVIWQVPKKNGYTADTLPYKLWSDIKYQGKPVWNICPVQEADQPGAPGLFFLSVRPGDISNDTVFVHRISDNYGKPGAQFTMKVLKSNKSYGVPPSAPQTQAGFKLQTNDARVLGAFYVNNKIQFVQTSKNTINGRSSVYHGIIQFPDRSDATVSANIISYDTLDIAYPTIAHAGNSVFGKQSLITFSHTGENVFPGTSVLYFNNDGEYSDLVFAKKGEGYINSFIVDSMERWGDYTAIQRSTVNPKEFWLVGSYGRNNNVVGTWVSKISLDDPAVGLNSTQLSNSENYAFPNPVVDVLTIPFELESASNVVLKITDVTGKEILVLNEYQASGKQKAFINTSNFKTGIYFYTIISGSNTIINGTFSKQ
ncbi:MAG TPA: T9SS type A sorting domain-containing protein [Bacteroidia bacterium]